MRNGSYFPGRGTLVEEKFLEGKAEGRKQGRREGWREGWREAWREGWQEGRKEERTRLLLRMLKTRDIAVSDEQHECITSCTDPELHLRWLDMSVRVTDTEELFEGAGSPGEIAEFLDAEGQEEEG